MPHCMLAPTTPTISGFTARKMSQLPTRLCGGVTETPNWVGRETLPLKLLLAHYLGQRVAEKPSTFLDIYMSLCLTTITNISSAL